MSVKVPCVNVVGAGNWGKNLVRVFHSLGALVGVAEADPALRSAVVSRYPELPVFADYHEALESSTQAVVIATPAPTHYTLAKAALEAGKDVYVEKPMALQADQARELASYAEAHQRVLMVGHLLLYQPAIRWMRDYLVRGEAGKVWHVATRRAKLGRVRREENVWWSFAPHDVSVILDLLGNPTVEGVRAQGHAMLQPGIEDDVHVSLSFASGQTAHLHTSWYWPLNERKTVVLAEKKMLVYDELVQTVMVYDKGVDKALHNRDEGCFVADVADADPLRLECEHFLHCLSTRQPPRSDGWNGLAVVTVLEGAQAALHG
jgi:predicted dehydrogenase